MKFQSLLAMSVLACATGSLAAPSRIQKRAACDAPVTLSGNPFADRTLYANKFYAEEVAQAASEIADATLAAKAASVAEIGTFIWADKISVIAGLQEHISDTPCEEIFGLVIYDLPGRDCAAKASNGELPVGAIEQYKSEYIDPIKAVLEANPNTAFALVIEPDSLPNLITNIDLQTCQDSAAGYEEGVAYALAQLNLPNVIMYIDAGHGGWLGWDANLKPGAEGLAKVYKDAGSPSQVAGIATNVAGWNAWSLVPGEFENTPDGQYNKCHDEKRFIANFAPELAAAGMPNHAIIDTARNGVQGLRLEWGNWCNVIGAGFGVRPTAETGDPLVDAFVWVKPGGESDGTSDTSAVRYDSFCGHEDAFKPSPEAGAWNQAYFEALVQNANPAL